MPMSQIGQSEWASFPNFCVSALDTDLEETDFPKIETLKACQSECAIDLKCSAIEWYSRVVDGSKCKLVLTDIPATKGWHGSRYKGATCYIKPLIGTSVLAKRIVCWLKYNPKTNQYDLKTHMISRCILVQIRQICTFDLE